MSEEIQIPIQAMDFESIKYSLSTNLINYDSWKGYLTTQTGTVITDFVSTIGASANLKSLRYLQEAFLGTASSDRGIYSIADMQGVRLTRKQPSYITVTISYTAPNVGSPTSISIPQFSQFQGGGTYWYSRDAVALDSGNSISLTLYQGYIVDQTTNGLDTDYQSFMSIESGFVISDEDVYVFVNGTQITRATNGLWNYANTKAFADKTTPTGNLLILFGSTEYGGRILSSDTVRIVYAVTSGLDGNSLSLLTARVSQVNNQVPGVSLTVLTNPVDGANQVTAAQFKQTGAISYGTFDSAVTRSQYGEVILKYPGVIDAVTFAQREIDTTDYRWMNVIRVVLLTDSVWTQTQKNAYISYVQSVSMYAPGIVLGDPVPLVSDVSGRLYCYNQANLSQCQADASTALIALFAPRAGILEYDISESDIHAAVKAANSGIERFDLYTPTSDLMVSSTPMLPPTLVIGTGGTLSVGTYTYALGVQMSNGVIAPKNWLTVTTTSANASITLSWNPYPGAINYFVYGRSSTPGYGLLATVPATSSSYVDTGSGSVGAAPPSANTTPVQYNKLGNLTIQASYSTRGTRSL